MIGEIQADKKDLEAERWKCTKKITEEIGGGEWWDKRTEGDMGQCEG